MAAQLNRCDRCDVHIPDDEFVCCRCLAIQPEAGAGLQGKTCSTCGKAVAANVEKCEKCLTKLEASVSANKSPMAAGELELLARAGLEGSRAGLLVKDVVAAAASLARAAKAGPKVADFLPSARLPLIQAEVAEAKLKESLEATQAVADRAELSAEDHLTVVAMMENTGRQWKWAVKQLRKANVPPSAMDSSEPPEWFRRLMTDATSGVASPGVAQFNVIGTGELAAMGFVEQVMVDLDDAQVWRVLVWAVARWGHLPLQVLEHNQASEAGVADDLEAMNDQR